MQTTWGAVTVVGMNPFQGSAVASTGRRLLQNGTGLKAEGNKPVSSLPGAGLRPDLLGVCVRHQPRQITRCTKAKAIKRGWVGQASPTSHGLDCVVYAAAGQQVTFTLLTHRPATGCCLFRIHTPACLLISPSTPPLTLPPPSHPCVFRCPS